jgi:bifunctional DNase/RNase
MNPDIPKIYCCDGDTWFIVCDVSQRIIQTARHFCKEHGQVFLQDYWPTTLTRCVSDEWYVFDVESTLYENDSTDIGCGIMLREAKSICRVGFKTGWNEIWELNAALSGIKYSRPFLYQVYLNTIRALGADISAVQIDDFIPEQQTFYAKLNLIQNGNNILIDLKPSHAVTLAIASNVNILISSQVLKKLEESRGCTDNR